MYAIVEVLGKQYKMAEGAVMDIDRMAVEGKTVSFDRVLLVANDKEIKVGKPTVENVKITATVIDNNAKGDKLIVFKWKRRKMYRRKRGHRQKYTKIKITKIEI
jgi:large subunit ribosomal protein L21